MEENPDGFGNSALSEAFLVSGKPGYLGNAIRYSDDMYGPWGEIEQAIRKGTPTVRAEAYLGGDAEKTRHFVYGMHERALGIGRALVEMVDLSGFRRMLDLGGGPGTYSALFTQRYPGLKATVLDLPDVASLGIAPGPSVTPRQPSASSRTPPLPMATSPSSATAWEAASRC